MTTYSYANTLGTGSRTGTITVTTTATLGGGTAPHLVDGNKGANSTNACFFAAGQSGVEVKFDLGSSKIIRQARWFQDTTNTHGTWKWRGSNDDSSYTDIGAAFTLGGVNGGQIHTTLIDNTTAYRYYKLVQQTGTTSSGPWLEEIEFFIEGATDDEGDTSYAYPLGGDTTHAGDVATVDGDGLDRRTHITATANYAGASGEVFSAVVNGSTAHDTTNSYEFQAKTDYILKFAFDVAQRITAHTLQLSNGTAEGTYTLEGSNDDSAYTSIATGVAFPASSFQEVAYTNVTAYKYYRFTQTGGTTSSSPWVTEMYFKLVPTVHGGGGGGGGSAILRIMPTQANRMKPVVSSRKFPVT